MNPEQHAIRVTIGRLPVETVAPPGPCSIRSSSALP